MPSRRALPAALVLLLLPASAHAAPESAFVPAKFRVEYRRSVDLNGDGRADRALVLRRRGNYGKQHPGAADRRLVVLRRSGNGYKSFGEARRALVCTTCGGAFYGITAPPIRLARKGSTLIVRQDFGSREVTEQTLRFGLRGRSLRLIGYDQFDRDRASGATTDTSTNLITGERVVKTRDENGRDSTKRSRVAVKPIAIKRVDYVKLLSL